MRDDDANAGGVSPGGQSGTPQAEMARRLQARSAGALHFSYRDRMPEQHRSLDWLARRHAGESSALIARRAGVSEATVARATKAYGPFPRPTEQLNRTTLSDDTLSDRAARWVEARRRGHTTTGLARAEGVSHQIVSRATRDHGPYPAAEVVDAWADARRAGRTLAVIADEYGVAPSVVRRETAKLGPFPMPGARLPEGVLGVSAVAARAGVSSATAIRWRDTGRLPDPDFVTARGRQLWLPTTIDAWLGESGRPRSADLARARS